MGNKCGQINMGPLYTHTYTPLSADLFPAAGMGPTTTTLARVADPVLSGSSKSFGRGSVV